MDSLNAIALCRKIPNIPTLKFSNLIKNFYVSRGVKVSKVGFSGILDPFASGQVILAFGGYTRLLPHIRKEYKTYVATLWLGLNSKSLDTENVVSVSVVDKIPLRAIEYACNLKGIVSYTIPSYSAKHINGSRAYKLARSGNELNMGTSVMEVKYLEILNYSHPFLSFKLCISEGGYVRSVGNIISGRLGVDGSLCYLERVQEGDLSYGSLLERGTSVDYAQVRYGGLEYEIPVVFLDINSVLSYDKINLREYEREALNGARLDLKQLGLKPKKYLADFGSMLAIVELTQNGEMVYVLNRIGKDADFI